MNSRLRTFTNSNSKTSSSYCTCYTELHMELCKKTHNVHGAAVKDEQGPSGCCIVRSLCLCILPALLPVFNSEALFSGFSLCFCTFRCAFLSFISVSSIVDVNKFSVLNARTKLLTDNCNSLNMIKVF